MAPVSRLEPILVAFFLATWFVNLLDVLGLVELSSNFNLALYPLYSLAAGMGWGAGLVYVTRAHRLPAELRRRVWMVYFMGPPGILFLVRAMAALDVQRAAPLVPVYAWGVFAVFFLVQVRWMPHPHLHRSRPGGDSEHDRNR